MCFTQQALAGVVWTALPVAGLWLNLTHHQLRRFDQRRVSITRHRAADSAPRIKPAWPRISVWHRAGAGVSLGMTVAPDTRRCTSTSEFHDDN